MKRWDTKNWKVGEWYQATPSLSGFPEWPAVCSQYECEYKEDVIFGMPIAFRIIRIRE